MTADNTEEIAVGAVTHTHLEIFSNISDTLNRVIAILVNCHTSIGVLKHQLKCINESVNK